MSVCEEVMRVLYGEGVANHAGPESCGRPGKGPAEALDRGTCGLAIEPRNTLTLGCQRCPLNRKATPGLAILRVSRGPHAVKDPSKHACILRENREILRPPREDSLRGRIGKSKDVSR